VLLATQPAEKPKAGPAALAGVAGVSAERDGRLFVQAKDGESIVAQVSTTLRAQGIDIDEITVESGRLDEVFRQITTQQPAHA